MKRSKTYQSTASTIEAERLYSPVEAINAAKTGSKAKFDETVDVALRLGVDPRKADQMVRGTVNLPNGTGKTARVLVFATGDRAEAAKAAGADEVGADELIEKAAALHGSQNTERDTDEGADERSQRGKLEGSRKGVLDIGHHGIRGENRIPEIADNVVDVDRAMRWGFGWELGPFEVWDAIGVEKSVSRMKKEGMPVPANVEQMLASGATSFYKKDNGQQFYFDFASGKYVPLADQPGVLILKSIKDRTGVIKKNAGASLIDIGDGVAPARLHTAAAQP